MLPHRSPWNVTYLELGQRGKKLSVSFSKLPLPPLLPTPSVFYTFALLLLLFLALLPRLPASAHQKSLLLTGDRGKGIRPGSIHHDEAGGWGWGRLVSFALLIEDHRQQRVWQLDMHFVNHQLRLSSDSHRFQHFCFFFVFLFFFGRGLYISGKSCSQEHIFYTFLRAHLF